MTELLATALWAGVFVYAVWSTRQAALAFLARRDTAGTLAMRKDMEWQRAEMELLRKDLNKTTRVASSASLAAGMREDPK